MVLHISRDFQSRFGQTISSFRTTKGFVKHYFSLDHSVEFPDFSSHQRREQFENNLLSKPLFNPPANDEISYT